MADQLPKTCAITKRVLPAGSELHPIRLDARTAKHFSTLHRQDLRPGLYHASIECADELRRIKAEDSQKTDKPRTFEQIGYKELT